MKKKAKPVEPMMVLTVSEQEFHTILAALRYYQEHGQGNPSNRSDYIHAIATNVDQTVSLDDVGIDQLCMRINTGGEYERPL